MESPIRVKGISLENLSDCDKCDGTFLVDSELVLSVENDIVSYGVVPIDPYKKRYVADKNRDLSAYIGNPRGNVYLAYVGEQVVGQMIIYINWNGFCLIEDLEVDVNWRRQGVGTALIQQAILWTRKNKLPGIMLETQNNNVPACVLYEKNGFVLGGYDKNLYKAIDPQTREIALFWYLFIMEE